MVLHYVHNHLDSISKKSERRRRMAQFVRDMSEQKEILCLHCMQRATSPLTYALHNDRHYKYMSCEQCRKNYVSPFKFYMEDYCRRNSLPSK